MEIKINSIRLSLIQGDITKQATDAIVNSANPTLMGGGGVDGDIHQEGGPTILEECKSIVSKEGMLPTGKAAITTSGNLVAKYVIHTVGPVWYDGNRGEAELLASAYKESLKLADDNKLSSISFPSISTGAYGYPVPEAARVAIQAVTSFLKDKASSLREVVFVLFDRKTYNAFRDALQEVAERQ
jgi:O-acetyl-ADP-ribose deacetylase (regulator of RNase III)